MREAKERRRMELPAPDYPPDLPELRRQIVVRDFDFGEVEYTFDLLRSNRIDCYRIRVDGKELPGVFGWSRALEVIRKGFLRVSGQ
jgi:hypothetical protein